MHHTCRLPMVTHNLQQSRYQPCKVADPSCGQLNGENYFFSCLHSRQKIWSGGTSSSAVPSRVSFCSLSTLRLNLMLTHGILLPLDVLCGIKDTSCSHFGFECPIHILIPIFIMEISVYYRRHRFQVRSLTLDRWTAPLLELLEKGGNDRANKVG